MVGRRDENDRLKYQGRVGKTYCIFAETANKCKLNAIKVTLVETSKPKNVRLIQRRLPIISQNRGTTMLSMKELH